MLLPFVERAFANDSKFTDYCLNPEHPIGKHKARVFQAALGITVANGEILKDTILDAVLLNSATYQGKNSYGELYSVTFSMSYNKKEATICSTWIIHDGENFPRLTSCYVIS